MGTGVASGGAAPAPAGHSDLHHPLPLAAAGIGSEDTHCPGLSRPGTITSLRDSEKCGCCGSPAAGNGSAPWRGCWRLEFSGPGPWLSLRLGCGSSPLASGARLRRGLEPLPEQSSAPPAMTLLVGPRASPWRSPACGPGVPSVQVRRIAVDVRVRLNSSGRFRKACACVSSPWQMRLTSDLEMPLSQLSATTSSST